jgi:hypothetical protein
MSNRKFYNDAIAEAKAIRETALANAKLALEEAFTPQIQSMLEKRLQQEEDELDEEVELDEAMSKDEMDEAKHKDEMDEAKKDEMDEAKKDEMDEAKDEVEEAKKEEDMKEAMSKEKDMDEDMYEEGSIEEIDLDELLAELEAAEEGYSKKDGMKKGINEQTDDIYGDGDVVVSISNLSPGMKAVWEIEKEISEFGDSADAQSYVDDMAQITSEEELVSYLENRDIDTITIVQMAKAYNSATVKKEAMGETAVKEAPKSKEDAAMMEAEAEDEVGEITVDELKDIIRDILKDVLGGGMEGEEDMEVDVDGDGDMDIAMDVDADGDIEVDELNEKKYGKEMDEVKADLNEAISVINTLKSELNEVNLLNAKLLYVNKLFRTKTLTEAQKVKVINSFDRAESVKEVKNIFETIKDALTTETKKPIKESRSFASKAAGVAPKQPIVENNDFVARMQKLAGII